MACLTKNDTGFLEVTSLNFLYEIIVLIKTTADFQLILTSLYNSRSLSRHARGQSRDPRLCETSNSLVRPKHSLASRNAFLYSTINISTNWMSSNFLFLEIPLKPNFLSLVIHNSSQKSEVQLVIYLMM